MKGGKKIEEEEEEGNKEALGVSCRDFVVWMVCIRLGFFLGGKGVLFWGRGDTKSGCLARILEMRGFDENSGPRWIRRSGYVI